MERGFSLIEILIVVAVIAVLSAIAIPVMQDAVLKATISAVATDATAIHVAFKRYHVDFSVYPDPGDFDLATFEPLVSLDYYDGGVVGRLVADQADGYDAPDDSGPNQEFWLELSLKMDPTTRFLVSDSDNSLLGGGDYYDGVFLFKDGVFTPIQTH